MSTAQPTRRSRRGDKHVFSVGDKVEVVRTNGVEIGTLVCKIEDSDDESPTNTHTTNRWIVGFEGDGESQEEEEVNENRMVELTSNNESESSSSKSSGKKTVAAAKRTKAKNGRYVQNKRTATGSTDENGETVVKVKMLTGTLYLYRGLNPRAEFVRSV